MQLLSITLDRHHEYNRNAKSLADLEYKFDKQGKLVHIKTGEPFKFLEQAHYELLGDLVAEHIQGMMKQSPYNMKEVLLPLEPTDPLYISPKTVTEKKDPLKQTAVRVTRAASKKMEEDEEWEDESKVIVDVPKEYADKAKSPIYMSADAMTNPNKLMIISCGAGKVM
jgi:hypothetical protein